MLKDLSVKAQLVLVITLMSLLLVFIGGFELIGMSRNNDAFKSVYDDRVVPLGQLAEIQRLTSRNAINVNSALVAPTPEIIGRSVADIDANIARTAAVWADYMATTLTKEEEILARKLEADRKNFLEKALLPASNALRANDIKEASRLVTEELAPRLKLVGEGLEALTKLQVDVAKVEFEAAQSHYFKTRTVSILVVCSGVILAALMGYLLVRSLFRKLGGEPTVAADAANRIAAGDLSKPLVTTRGDTTSIMAAMAKMQTGLKAFVAAQQELAQQHEAGAISYRIPESQFSGCYRDMAEGINKLTHSHIAVKMKMVDVIKCYARGDFNADMENLPGEKAVITTACVDAKRNLQAMQSQIAELAMTAAQGDFSKRGDASRFEHGFRDMVNSLNDLMETADAGLNDVSRILRAC
jgi:methyl-accepting chemotaxis protein